MPTLILSSPQIAAERALAEAARSAGWKTCGCDDGVCLSAKEHAVFYGGVDRALDVAMRYGIALLEPPFDMLAHLPRECLLRTVEFGRFRDLSRLKSPTFVKPADSLNKVFDAGVYSSARDIRSLKPIDPDTAVLVAEPVEWNCEFRCFVLDGSVTAWSRYISYGRPTWKPFAAGIRAAPTPRVLTDICNRLFARSRIALPPAFVMDVGQIEDRGWAIVEFNPAWCSGLVGADPRNVLRVLERASVMKSTITAADRRWVVSRPSSSTGE